MSMVADRCVRPTALAGGLPSGWAEPWCLWAVALPDLRYLSSTCNRRRSLPLRLGKGSECEPGGRRGRASREHTWGPASGRHPHTGPLTALC